jgi:hypothetical protein
VPKIDGTSDDELVCAYCGHAVLDGTQPPEHPIAHALGASLEIFTTCIPCNSWANVHVAAVPAR